MVFFHNKFFNFISPYLNIRFFFVLKSRESPSLVKGGGLRIHSHRSSGVQISLSAFFLIKYTNNILFLKKRKILMIADSTINNSLRVLKTIYKKSLIK